MASIRYSQQRELLLADLKSRKDHPTADMLYSSLREQLPNISLGTVYRNLNLLLEMGLIQKIESPAGSDRFDGNATAHYHFLCKQCGRVSDVDMPLHEELDAAASAVLHAEVHGHKAIFEGVCPACTNGEGH